jgi:carbon starvation protein
MMSVVVVILGLIVYAIAYFVYGKWFDRKIMESNPKKTTPAHVYMDGVEFFPTSKYVLLGFQWKSIAAAGPITGPIIAFKWGWLPALIWVLLGNLFIGWIHDYSGVMVSVKNDGVSFGPLSYQLIGPRARLLLLSFITFYLLLSTSSYGMIVAKSYLGKYPAAPIIFLLVTIIAIIAGVSTFKLKINVVYTTLAAIILMIIVSYIGLFMPVKLPEWIAKDPYLFEDFWYFWVLLFCFIGSVTPIWLFVQPVNYMCFYLVYGMLIAVMLGVFVGHPDFNQPAFVSFIPTGMDPLVPLLFVTVACGAISGWHSLVGSSISSKQLDNEADALFVGGGAMLMEGILSLVTIGAVAPLLPAEVKGLTAPDMVALGWAKSLGYLGFSVEGILPFVAAVIAVLVLTVLHLNLRIMRLGLAELFGARMPVFKNIYFASIIPCILAYLLGSSRFGGVLLYVWTLFGGANQLLAGMNLVLATLYLVRIKKPAYFTSIPAIFMLAICLSALSIMTYTTYITAMKATGLAIVGNLLATIVGILLLILGIIFIYDSVKAYSRLKKAA